jgi:hypothetical protein
VRHRFHRTLKAAIWHLQHTGLLSAQATERLIAAIDERMDRRKTHGWLRWEDLRQYVGAPAAWVQRMQTLPVLGSLAKRRGARLNLRSARCRTGASRTRDVVTCRNLVAGTSTSGCSSNTTWPSASCACTRT